jgi:large subunit ribosomal protein L19e
MELKTQKRIAADVLNCSPKRVFFSPDHLEEIKESITKHDIRELINANIIQKQPKAGVSRGNARKLIEQKRKGRRKSHGSRKGKATARLPKKEVWKHKVRLQREFLKKLKERGMISIAIFNDLYRKSNGGFFRSLNHMKYFIKERNFIQNEKSKN